MGLSIFDKIQAKLELLRLEKRYTRSRHRRSAFISNAVYVDGEYVFQTPNSTGSSTSTTGTDALHGAKAGPSPPAIGPEPLSEEDEHDAYGAQQRRQAEPVDADIYAPRPPPKVPSRRFSRFNMSTTPPVDDFSAPTPRSVETDEEERQRKRLNRHSSMPGFGGSYDIGKSASRFSERRLSMIR